VLCVCVFDGGKFRNFVFVMCGGGVERGFFLGFGCVLQQNSGDGEERDLFFSLLLPLLFLHTQSFEERPTTRGARKKRG